MDLHKENQNGGDEWCWFRWLSGVSIGGTKRVLTSTELATLGPVQLPSPVDRMPYLLLRVSSLAVLQRTSWFVEGLW